MITGREPDWSDAASESAKEPVAQLENGSDPHGVMLSLVCAIADYAHESITTVLEWPWAFFCAMGCRMIRYNYDERRRREAQDEERELAAEEADLRRRHAQLTGRM